MDFSALKKFLNSLEKDYGIPDFDCAIYYDHNYVFRYKTGLISAIKQRTIPGRNLYLLHSGAKLISGIAVMQLIEQYKLSLDDPANKYVSTVSDGVSVSELLSAYSRDLKNEESEYSHRNVAKLVENASGMAFGEFVRKYITEPLKMKDTAFEITDKNRNKIAARYAYDSNRGAQIKRDFDAERFFEDNAGSLITSVDDYTAFCETLCGKGVSARGYRLLSEYSVDMLINNIMYNETEKNDAFVSVGYHGSLILIDIKKKITIVYAQHMKNLDAAQLDMYPRLRKLAYECIGADTWSKGYNVFG